MSTWPADDLTTASLDAGTDDPSQSRAELLAAVQKLQTILAAAGTGASQVHLLTSDGSSEISKAAATGYSRVSPNMCRVDSLPSETGLTRDAVTLVTGPTGCHGLILLINARARSNNSIALRTTSIYVYSDSGATTTLSLVSASAYEHVGVAAGTVIGENYTEVHVKTDSSGQVWLKLTDDSGNQGTGSYMIAGYYD